jgi:hypothetical protein
VLELPLVQGTAASFEGFGEITLKMLLIVDIARFWRVPALGLLNSSALASRSSVVIVWVLRHYFTYKNEVGLNLPKNSKLILDSRKLLKLSRARNILVFSS